MQETQLDDFHIFPSQISAHFLGTSHFEMASRADPSALLLRWKLTEGFEVVVCQPVTKEARPKLKKYGTVVDIRDTEKGKVENKSDQVLMLITTTTMKENAQPLALQVALLDFKGLDKDIITAYNKKLPASPTLIQIARKQALLAAHVTCMCDGCMQVN